MLTRQLSARQIDGHGRPNGKLERAGARRSISPAHDEPVSVLVRCTSQVVAPLPRTSTEQRTEQSGWASDVVRALFLDWQPLDGIAPSRTLRSDE
jgi:hypothetical protein